MWFHSTLKARVTTREEDSLAPSLLGAQASSHECMQSDPMHLDASVWDAYVDMPRWYVDVVSPCEEAKERARVPTSRAGKPAPPSVALFTFFLTDPARQAELGFKC